MYGVSPAGSPLSDIVARVVRKELGGPLNWRRLYSLSWLYALARSMRLREEEELYSSLRGTVSEVLGDEGKFGAAIYDHEGAAGILFSLYHIATREGVPGRASARALEAVKRLRWHDFDGEIMAFSYMLAGRVGARDYAAGLEGHMGGCLGRWAGDPDYLSQRGALYILFAYAYTLHRGLAVAVRELGLYSPGSAVLQRAAGAHDVELPALALYVLGRAVYNKKLRRQVEKRAGKGVVGAIRYGAIPYIGRVLAWRVSEARAAGQLAPDLLAKAYLALAEAGLDRPFALSKHEWRAYREAVGASRRGYYWARRRHLVIGLVLNAVLLPPSLALALAPVLAPSVAGHPQYGLVWWLSPALLNTLYGANLSLYRHGTIEKNYLLLGAAKHIAELLRPAEER